MPCFLLLRIPTKTIWVKKGEKYILDNLPFRNSKKD